MSDPYLSWPAEMQDMVHATIASNMREQRAIRVNASRQLGISLSVMNHAQSLADADPTPQNLEDLHEVKTTVAGLVLLIGNATDAADKLMANMAGKSEALRSRIEATLAATEEEDATEGPSS